MSQAGNSAPARSRLGRGWDRYRSWPLWAKISAPVAVLALFGAVLPNTNDSADTAAVTTVPAATSTTASSLTTSMVRVQPIAEVPADTQSIAAPTTPAPTPPPTPAPTTPPPEEQVHERFDTCKEAIAHGNGPYYQGTDVEYGWYRDANSNGIVCE